MVVLVAAAQGLRREQEVLELSIWRQQQRPGTLVKATDHRAFLANEENSIALHQRVGQDSTRRQRFHACIVPMHLERRQPAVRRGFPRDDVRVALTFQRLDALHESIVTGETAAVRLTSVG